MRFNQIEVFHLFGASLEFPPEDGQLAVFVCFSFLWCVWDVLQIVKKERIQWAQAVAEA